jgi:hypothetical protein
LSWFIVFPLFASCGGDAVLQCENTHSYLQAAASPRIKAPEGLDELDALKEMPVPEASPQREAPVNVDCLEAPPTVIGSD